LGQLAWRLNGCRPAGGARDEEGILGQEGGGKWAGGVGDTWFERFGKLPMPNSKLISCTLSLNFTRSSFVDIEVFEEKGELAMVVAGS